MTRKTETRPERELVPGQSEALLRELHLVSRDGKLHADSLRKLKQVNHLARLLKPALEDVLARHPQAQILDAGAGNAYLGFVLYELFLREGEAVLWNVEPRRELVARGEERARKLGYTRMRFLEATLEQAAAQEKPTEAQPAAAQPATTISDAPAPAPGPLDAAAAPDGGTPPAPGPLDAAASHTATPPAPAGEAARPKLPALPSRLHLVTALHACDTATDDALLTGCAARPTTSRSCPAARPRSASCSRSTPGSR